MENKDTPAFPIILDTHATPSGRVVTDDYFDGLTKREMMAMHMMTSILAHGAPAYNHAAEDAVIAADALLAELERTA